MDYVGRLPIPAETSPLAIKPLPDQLTSIIGIHRGIAAGACAATREGPVRELRCEADDRTCGRVPSGQASKLSNDPLEPVLANRISAVPPVCSASAELNNTAEGELVETAVDVPLEGLALLDELDDAELVEELAVVEAGAVGWKLEFWAPKPTFDANRPATEMKSVRFLPVRTSSPLEFNDAVTCALAAMFGLLMALIKSPTVSVPVDAKVVVLVPSLTVIVPFSGIPSVMSDVVDESGTVPVPVAAAPAAGALAVEPPELACEAWTALCSAATNWAWTRVAASPAAILAKPLA